MIAPSKPSAGFIGASTGVPSKQTHPLQALLDEVTAARHAKRCATYAFEHRNRHDKQECYQRGLRYELTTELFEKLSPKAAWAGIRWDADLGESGEYYIPKVPGQADFITDREAAKKSGFPGHSSQR